MRAFYAVLATVAALLTTSNVASADTKGGDLNRSLRSNGKADMNTGSIHEEREGLLDLPEELEELVETHHHIREMFTRWCLEEKEPEEAEKGAKSVKEAKYAKLYKLYMSNVADKNRRKLEVKGPECDLLKTKQDE